MRPADRTNDPVAELGYILQSLRLRAALGRGRSIVRGAGDRRQAGDPLTEVLAFEAECWDLVKRWQPRVEGARAQKIPAGAEGTPQERPE